MIIFITNYVYIYICIYIYIYIGALALCSSAKPRRAAKEGAMGSKNPPLHIRDLVFFSLLGTVLRTLVSF